MLCSRLSASRRAGTCCQFDWSSPQDGQSPCTPRDRRAFSSSRWSYVTARYYERSAVDVASASSMRRRTPGRIPETFHSRSTSSATFRSAPCRIRGPARRSVADDLRVPTGRDEPVLRRLPEDVRAPSGVTGARSRISNAAGTSSSSRSSNTRSTRTSGEGWTRPFDACVRTSPAGCHGVGSASGVREQERPRGRRGSRASSGSSAAPVFTNVP